MVVEPQTFECRIRDQGEPFEPEAITDPDMKRHVALGKKNGLGMFLMRQVMDSVEYRFDENEMNELCMRKYCAVERASDNDG